VSWKEVVQDIVKGTQRRIALVSVVVYVARRRVLVRAWQS